MSPFLIIVIILLYFALLISISWYTSRNANNDTFFIGNRESSWYLVAFGMIGASLSGVTFISIPGWVGSSQFSYIQMVLGYLVGYFVIANVLMPVYYKLQLTSIYTYLEGRFGFWSYKTGASFFLLSRFIGASFRLYLSAAVLQVVLFDKMNVPFWLTTSIIIFFIWLFTWRGGIKTIIWTDTIQTTFMLASLVFCIYILANKLGLSFGRLAETLYHSDYTRIFFFDDWSDKRHFVKQFLSGALISVVMTGLDQDLMQKNLSCKNIGDAKKNMYWFSLILIPVNFLFLALGALLYIYAQSTAFPIPAQADQLFPMIATQPFMPPFFLAIFIIGLVSTTYSSGDSALTSLTTSFTIDILDIKKRSEKEITRIRQMVHIIFTVIIILLILVFKSVNNDSVVNGLFVAASYTYGPLLGLYMFGLFTRYKVHDHWVPAIAILSPILSFVINYILIRIFNFELGYLVLAINGLLTFTGLYLARLTKPLPQ